MKQPACNRKNEAVNYNLYNKITFTLLCFYFFLSASSLAQSPVGFEKNLTSQIPFNSIKTGSLYLKSTAGYFSSLQQNSNYDVQVNGLLARVTLTQSFTNSSEEFLEGIYVFPLIDDAAVDSMVMEIGDRRIIGKIKEKKQAKRIYQKAKEQGKKASLVSQQRPNMFTSKLSNIAPGETIKIIISYLQSVNYSDDEFSLRIPLTITPRYSPYLLKPKPVNGHDDDAAEKNENLQYTRAINNSGWENFTPPQTYISDGQKVNISMILKTGLPITNIVSHNHQIKKQNRDNSVELTLASNNVLLDKDFVISWQVAQGQSPKAAFFQSSDENYYYGLLMIMPPSMHQGQTISKKVTYILDTSGSMAGVAIEQAKQALITALDLLNHEDSFNIISFNSTTASLFLNAKLANQANIIKAKHWIKQQIADGGTNMYPAIAQALANRQQHLGEEKYHQVIFITDGSVNNELELFDLIENSLGNTRLHTVGIGSAPNTYFMSRAAESGRGTYRYIGSINEVNSEMYQLFSDISQPMMKNITLHWPDENIEYYPKLIPDLYQNKPLVLSMRWPLNDDTYTSKEIEVTGQLAGQDWSENIKTKLSRENNKKLGIDQWWARQKIKHLSQEYQRSDDNKKLSLKAQITELALKHHLISSYTSFVAVEERVSRDKNNKLTTKNIANLMPKGSMQAIPLANTSLGLSTSLYLGGAFLLISSLLLLFKLRLRRIEQVDGL